MLLCAVAGACRATGDVVVDVTPDGSGTVAVTVHVDAEALERVGDLAKAVKVDDLTAHGWTASTPVTARGTTSLTVTKPFGSAAGLAGLMSEVSGRSGLLGRWDAKVTDGFASTGWSAGGTITATGDLAQFSDEGLASALDGLPLGRTSQELAAEWGGATPSLPVTFTVRLPDGTEQSRVVDLASGRPTSTAVRAEGSRRDTAVLWWLAAGAGAFVVGLVALMGGRRRTAGRRP